MIEVKTGDDFELERRVTDVPTGQVLDRAWFTIKKRYIDLDEDAVYQAIITTSTTASGVITHIADTIDRLNFYLYPADTELLNPAAEYVYDIQVRTNAGFIKTVEDGTIVGTAQVTRTVD